MTDSIPDIDDAWSRRFLEAHLSRHPVDATFVGIHDHDHRLPAVDEQGVEETVSTLETLRDEAGADHQDRDDREDDVGRAVRGGREGEGGGGFSSLDRRLVRGFLANRIWEYASGHVLGNPSAHVGDAVFGLMGPLLTDPDASPAAADPSAAALDAVRARLAGVPRFLADVREGFTSGRFRSGAPAAAGTPPAPWTWRAVRECRGGARFVEQGLDHLAGMGGGAWETERSAASSAFHSFARYLEEELLADAGEDAACGGEAFLRYTGEGHFLDRSPEEVVAHAREEMERTRGWLEEAASDHDASTPEEVLARLPDRHPSPDGYLEAYDETWDAMKRVALERDLVTWPDFPIEYVARPRWARAAAPDLYFLFYRSPPAFHRPPVHRYMVAPLDRGLSDEETEAFLRSNNDSAIKLNHVVHHGGIGHHVQNWHAFRSPSLVGRVAAVDCASRIAMFCGGTMAEGWACYATDLMAEAGALTDLEQYAEHHGRVRMCARAVVDVELHHGRMSLSEAAAFYRAEAGMSEGAAESEAVKNSMFPGAALMYLVGTDMIHELRRDILRIQGDAFELRGFHDAFLSYGSIPVKLIADEMRHRARAGIPLGAHDHDFLTS